MAVDALTVTLIIVGGLLMSAISLVGGLLLLGGKDKVKKIVMDLISFASGALIGGALFHMLPMSVEILPCDAVPFPFLFFALGFFLFLILEHVIATHGGKESSVGSITPPADVEMAPIEKTAIDTAEIQKSQNQPDQRSSAKHLPFVILLGDGIHNFIGGLSVGVCSTNDRPCQIHWFHVFINNIVD
jgi:zinc and cadmium transporter